MPKTIRRRVLTLASKKTFDSSLAWDKFTDYMTTEEIHNSVMRRARELAEVGLLKRQKRGKFVATARGKKELSK